MILPWRINRAIFKMEKKTDLEQKLFTPRNTSTNCTLLIYFGRLTNTPVYVCMLNISNSRQQIIPIYHHLICNNSEKQFVSKINVHLYDIKMYLNKTN